MARYDVTKDISKLKLIYNEWMNEWNIIYIAKAIQNKNCAHLYFL